MNRYCPRCGAKNLGREPVCASCGQKLYGLLSGDVERTTCVVCNAPSPATATYCTGCGRALDDPPPTVRASAPAAALESAGASGAPIPEPGHIGGIGGPPLPVEATPAHGVRGCLLSVAGLAVVLLAVFALVRQTQQSIAANGPASAPTRSAASSGADAGLGAGYGGTESRAAVIAAPGGRISAGGDRVEAIAAPDSRGAVAGGRVESGAAVGTRTAPPGDRLGANAPSGTAAAPALSAPRDPTTPPNAAASTARPATPAANLTPAVAQAGNGALIVGKGSVLGPLVAPGRGGSILVSVDRVAAADQLGDRQVTPGHRFLVVSAVIDNAGAGEVTYDGAAAQVVDGLGATISALPPPASGLGAGLIPPRGRAAGQLAFEVSAARRDLTFVLEGARFDLTTSLP